MFAKRNTSRYVARADPLPLPPPNLRALGVLQFTLQDRETLNAWLAEDGWPRGRMDVALLEGYLVALLVWPVGIAPGAWLPPIWGEKGWKVPAKIASPCTYRKFVELVVGFLQQLDRGLSTYPPSFAPTPFIREPGLRGRNPPGIPWAQGFLTALQQSSQGLHWRSDAARAAVSRIARYASSTAIPTGAHPVFAAELTAAVLTLAAERLSRGPLGALWPRDSGRLAPQTIAPTPSGISSDSDHRS